MSINWKSYLRRGKRSFGKLFFFLVSCMFPTFQIMTQAFLLCIKLTFLQCTFKYPGKSYAAYKNHWRSIMTKWSFRSCLLTVPFHLTCCLHLSRSPKGFALLSMKGTSTMTICNIALSWVTLSSPGKRKMPMQTVFSALIMVSTVLENWKMSCIILKILI